MDFTRRMEELQVRFKQLEDALNVRVQEIDNIRAEQRRLEGEYRLLKELIDSQEKPVTDTIVTEAENEE